jgi:hypothetical protein
MMEKVMRVCGVYLSFLDNFFTFGYKLFISWLITETNGPQLDPHLSGCSLAA